MHFRLFRRLSRLTSFLGILGPGVVSAVAGDDAGGIGTYSIAGAQFGYELLWVMIVITILLAIVQEMAMRLSVVTGKGLSDLIREEFGVRTTALAMLTLFIANGAVTISEFVGIAAAAQLLGVTPFFAVPPTAFFVWWVVVRGNYKRAERIFLTVGFLLVSYIISAVVVNPKWDEVLWGTFVPSVRLETDFLLVLIATIGTTISPYMQFTLSATIVDRAVQADEYKAELLETLLGVVLSNAFAYFIIVATGATLHPQGITQINSADQAARALEPIAGDLAEKLFAIGLLGASLLAACILPLSTTYAICEAFGWERGVNNSWSDARTFYVIYTVLIAIGALVALVPGAPLFEIFLFVYVLNGVLLPVLLVLMLRLANNRRLMGKNVNGRITNWLGWGTVAVIVLLTGMLFLAPIWSTLKR